MCQVTLSCTCTIPCVCTYVHSYRICSIRTYVYISLNTVVLNSRDWSGIIWLPKIFRFKNQPCNRFYLKKLTGMDWLGYNDAVSWLNEAKTRIFQPTANFENFKIVPVFRLPACHKTWLS